MGLYDTDVADVRPPGSLIKINRRRKPMTQGPIELTVAQLGMLTEEVRRPEGPGDAPHTKAFNDVMIAALREGKGRIEGELGAIDLLIMTSTGRKSGIRRPAPIGYFVVEGRLLIIASMGGADINPQWYHNIVANADVTVELLGEEFSATAVPTTGEDRERVFAAICAKAEVFSDYQSRTTRLLPVVELVPVDADISHLLGGPSTPQS